MNRRRPDGLGHPMRVAGLATAAVVVLAAAAVLVFDVLVAHRLTSQSDVRLSQALAHPPPSALAGLGSPSGSSILPARHDEPDVDDAPVFLWRVTSGSTVPVEEGAPLLPSRAWPHGAAQVTVTLGSSPFRLASTPVTGGWLVAGVSLAGERHIEHLLAEGELIALPVVALGMFLGSLFIGVTASRPVVAARRRELEFTADASHELRTPLSVIEAEVDLALRQPRDDDAYRATLARVREEGTRLTRIVEDLLWLARVDSMPPPPAGGDVDLADVVADAISRFSAPAQARGVNLESVTTGPDEALVTAPADWIDRLAGVLVDNACRYTPPGGRVCVTASVSGGRAVLAVDDDGPGIPLAERPRLFDRFHRATDVQGGTGLGLAIADSVVRSTGGRWSVGESRWGGAHMEVSWSAPQRVRRRPQPRPDAIEQ